MFGSIGMPELIIIFVIALIIFGPRKLPELGKSLGRSIGEFKRASNELRSTLEEEIRVEDQKAAAAKPPAPRRRTPPTAIRADRARSDRPARPMAFPVPEDDRPPRSSARPAPGPPAPPMTTTPTTARRARCRSSITSTSCAGASWRRRSRSAAASWSRSRSSTASSTSSCGRCYEKLPRVEAHLHRADRGLHAVREDRAAGGRGHRAPLIMWQLWLFIAPGLYANEKRFALPFILTSTSSSSRARRSPTTSCSRWRGRSSPASRPTT